MFANVDPFQADPFGNSFQVPQQQPQQQQPQQQTVFQAVAISDYVGTKSNHLSFKQGDIINLREQKDQWWSGEVKGRVNIAYKTFFDSIFYQKI